MSDADRLYELLPAVLRNRDAEGGEPLRALMAVLSGVIGDIEDDIETTWDNWFVETCEEWLVPYLGEALGVRGLRNVEALDFSLRSYVGNTLERRRRKGTIAATEQLARDVTGYPARAVEMFALTATTSNMNHLRLRDTRGVSIGTVDVRDPAVMSDVSGPFDPFVRTPDVRAMTGDVVRHNLANVELFLWRLRSYELSDSTARVDPTEAHWFRFDPLGLDRAIFTLPIGEGAITALAGPEHVPRPLSRLELAGFTAEDDWPIRVRFEADSGGPLVVTELTPIVCNLDAVGGLPSRQPAAPEQVLVDPELGRLVVHPDLLGPDPFEIVVDQVFGWPGDVGAGPYDRNGHLERFHTDQQVRFQCGVARHPQVVGGETILRTLEEAVVAWNGFVATVPVEELPGTAGVVVVMDSRTHPAPTSTINLPDGCTLSIIAAGWPRTEVDGVLDRHVGVVDADRLRPHIRGDVVASGQSSAGGAGGLILDGLLVEGAVRIGPGQLERLTILSCTIVGDPDGIVVTSGDDGSNSQLVIRIDRSITSAVVADNPIAQFLVEGSVVGSGPTAIDLPGALVEAQGSTLVGGIRCQVIAEATDCILDEGDASAPTAYRIEQTQQGCIRFSHVPAGASTPRRYRCQPDLALEGVTNPAERLRIIRAVHPVVSTNLTDSGFGLLAATASPLLRAAGSDGSEPGVWHHLQHARRMTNLQLELDRDLRFGLDAGFVLDR